MPLLKKKPFALLQPRGDLEPRELVYQIRFTKEIFRDYQQYLNRINLYRQRIWTCKISGKANLTYEEALVSEKHTSEKVQDIPNEFVAPALRIIQFSMLSLKDLADTIAVKLQEHLFVGAELHGKKDDDLYPCKILRVFEQGAGKTRYEVAWLDRDKEKLGNTVLRGNDLIWKKFPLSKCILKSFIRNSTYRSAPWVIHDKLAQKHQISSDPPPEFKDKVRIQNGLVLCDKKKRAKGEKVESTLSVDKASGNGQPTTQPIKYPIDDLLVQPGPAERPSPCRDFNVQMDCVGDLLMVWNFCSSFSRLLNLWPFPFQDLENAICHKDSSNLTLIVEAHSSLLRLLIKDNSKYLFAIKNKRQKLKITLINWTEFLCDFLETFSIPDKSTCTSMIKRGHYGLLDARAKIRIFQELVCQAIETDSVREKLDECVEQQRMLGATRREEARKKREEKEQSNVKCDSNADLANGHKVKDEGNKQSVSTNQNHSDRNGVISKKRKEKEQSKVKCNTNTDVANGHNVEDEGNKQSVSTNQNHIGQNGVIPKKRKLEITSDEQNDPLDESRSDHSKAAPEKTKNMDIEILEENGEKLSLKKSSQTELKDEKKDATLRGKDQRREYFELELEKRGVRTSSLGKDRDYNRYWWFRRDGRIFIESSDSKWWGYYSSKEELNSLMGSLNRKGERERALHKQLQKFYSRICSELQKRSKEAQRIALDEAVLRRSTRVHALPRENPANAFLRYVNKWKED